MSKSFSLTISELAPHFLKSFSELPIEIQTKVKAVFLSDWDSLNVEQRIIAADLHEKQCGELVGLYFNRDLLLDELEKLTKEALDKNDRLAESCFRQAHELIENYIGKIGDVPNKLKQLAEYEQLSNEVKPIFDKNEATYPPELDIAMQAWQAVTKTNEKATPKVRIKAWLDKNTSLTNEAKVRISIVANWKKLGGATRTE